MVRKRETRKNSLFTSRSIFFCGIAFMFIAYSPFSGLSDL
jgi:hypothetical protein